VFLVQLFVSHPASIYLCDQFQGLRLSGLTLSHQHSYPTLSSDLNIFSVGVFLLLLKTALFGLKQVLSIFTQSVLYDVDATSAENVALVTVTSQKQHAVFDKVIICPCYCIVFPFKIYHHNTVNR
jgi:hypothetical protein